MQFRLSLSEAEAALDAETVKAIKSGNYERANDGYRI